MSKTKKRTYKRNRIDYAILYDWFRLHPGKVLTHDDLRSQLDVHGRQDEFNHYRKALGYTARPVTTGRLREAHGFKGLVLPVGRGQFVYDPDAVIHPSSSRAVTRVVSGRVNTSPGEPVRVAEARSGEPPIVVYNRLSDVPTPTVPSPVPEQATNPHPLAEVWVDHDGTLVLHHEDGSVIVATVTARTTS